MGLSISRLLSRPFRKKTVRVLMVSLDGAGKTTILQYLKLDELVTKIPMVGLDMETVQFRNCNLTVWDVGGGDKIRQLWKSMYRNWRADALIFVVDSHNRERVREAAQEFHNLLDSEELRAAVVLVFVNKLDLPDSMSFVEISDKFKPGGIQKFWHIQESCALHGTGLYEGFTWLDTVLSKR